MDLTLKPQRPFSTERLLLASLLFAARCDLLRVGGQSSSPAGLQMSCDGLERGTAAHHITIQTLKNG